MGAPRLLVSALFLAMPLTGCAMLDAIGPLLGAEGASVLVLGRSLTDIGVSAATGRDCSIVRLDRGQTYCATAEPARTTELFCTRTLATPDCWTDPALLPGRHSGIADSPPPNPAQERYRAAPWPKAIFAE